MSHFRLKYEYPSVHSSSGSAWVMLGEYEMTQDCASAGELESAINALHGELDKIAKDGRQAFAETKKAQMEASARAKGS